METTQKTLVQESEKKKEIIKGQNARNKNNKKR